MIKRPRSAKQPGIVKEVETDSSKVQWSNGGRVPMFIKLEVAGKAGPELRVVGVKQIKFL